MTAQITTLIAVCDRLTGHVGQIKARDGSVPAAHWVPTLNELLDLRSILMKERDKSKTTTTTPKP